MSSRESSELWPKQPWQRTLKGDSGQWLRGHCANLHVGSLYTIYKGLRILSLPEGLFSVQVIDGPVEVDS